MATAFGYELEPIRDRTEFTLCRGQQRRAPSPGLAVDAAEHLFDVAKQPSRGVEPPVEGADG